MNKQLRRDFQRFLATGGYCTPPGRTACALDKARTLAEWREAEDATVRLRAEQDPEPYDCGDCGEAYVNGHGRRVSAKEARAEIERILERDGQWGVIAEWFDGTEWQHADSIWGCTGYGNPLDPFQNDYVPDLMASALKARVEFVEEMCAAV